ncbi:MAG: hypothetical protein ACI8TP_004762 [Acidimicrobiales bacterium]
MSAAPAGVSRALWEATERFHALCYFAPEVREEGAAAGLKGFWMNYFATRVAPVGAVGPDIVQSTFFYYGPTRVRRAIPDAWECASPRQIIAARYRGMDRSLRATYGDAITGDVFAEAAAIAAEAVQNCDPIGRLLHAGWASVERPAEPHLSLWHDCTLLREYRSGNHLIAVCAEGLDGCESVVSHVAAGGAPRAWIRDEAGWTEADEQVAVTTLRDRGWLDDDRGITEAGLAGRQRIEDLTDELDWPIWRQLGSEKGQRLFDLLSQLASSLPPDDQLDWKEHYER